MLNWAFHQRPEEDTRSGNATTTFTIRVVPLEGNPWFVATDVPCP